MNLYELSTNYRQLKDSMDELDLDPEVIADTLDSIQEPLNEKAENIIKLIQSFENEEKIIAEEIKRLTGKRQAVKRKTENLKHYLRDSLDLLPDPRVKTPLFSVWVQNNPPSVQITDEDKVGEDYLIPQPPKYDRRLMMEDIKLGKKVDGVEVKQTRGVRYR